MRGDERITGADRGYRLGKHRLRSTRWMLCAIAGIQLAILWVIAVVSSFFSNPPPFWLQLLLIEVLAYLIPLMLYARANRILTVRDVREGFGLKPCRKHLWSFVILGGVGCQFIMTVLNLPVNLILSVEDGFIPTTTLELLASVAVVAIIPAVFEEFLFRGIIYGAMKEFNTKGAMIFTTLMFAIMHGSIAGFLGYLLLGWALSMVMRYTGSLYACIVFHLANNLTALLLSYFSPDLLGSPMITIWLFIMGIATGIFALRGLFRWGKSEEETKVMKTSLLVGQSFTSLPIIISILCVIGIMILQ